MESVEAILLAAGKSSRCNRLVSKLLEPICGRELIRFPVEALHELSIPTTIILGHARDAIQACLDHHYPNRISYVIQEEARGTGHALITAREALSAENIIIIGGDMPLVTASLINELLQYHMQEQAAITFIVAHNSDPLNEYGRVIEEDGLCRIIEARDATKEQRAACCINAGIYIIKRHILHQYLGHLKPSVMSREYYLTDIIGLASAAGETVKKLNAPFDTIRGVNTLEELWATEHIKRSAIIKWWMLNGVRFHHAQSVHIDCDVQIEPGADIKAGVHLLGNTYVGNATIGPFSVIENSIIHNSAFIDAHSVVRSSTIQSHAIIGPFAHIRNQATIGKNACIGNFVEVKESTIGAATKAKHLTYIGNATIGEHVNIGAGTITCNHTGITRASTTIHDHAYIGSNNCLVAPVTIGAHSFTAAGSTITQDVPERALAIGRTRQVTKEEYAPLLKQRLANQHTHHSEDSNLP